LNLNLIDPDKAFDYVREAIDKYWSDGMFELTVNVGCATGRRLP
jgi:RNase adaptor protein for sRNA GlmZ degradation